MASPARPQPSTSAEGPLGKACINAIFESDVAAECTGGTHGGVQAVVAFAADHRVAAPQAERAIAFDGGGEDRQRNVREVIAEFAGDLLRRRGGEPAEGPMHRADHLEQFVGTLLEYAAARDQGGVRGEAASGGRV